MLHNWSFRYYLKSLRIYMSVWSSTVGETLNTKQDNREEAKDYNKFAIDVYKWDLLLDHVPTEISSLCYHFLNNNEQNTLTTIVTGKWNQEVGLAVPAKLFFQKKKKTENLLNTGNWACKEEKPFSNCES